MEVNGEYMAASSTVGGGRHAKPPPLARAVCQLFVSGADIVSCRTGRGAGGVGVVCGSSTRASVEAPGRERKADYGGRDCRMVAVNDRACGRGAGVMTAGSGAQCGGGRCRELQAMLDGRALFWRV
jgi:hypothetical protein